MSPSVLTCPVNECMYCFLFHCDLQCQQMMHPLRPTHSPKVSCVSAHAYMNHWVSLGCFEGYRALLAPSVCKQCRNATCTALLQCGTGATCGEADCSGQALSDTASTVRGALCCATLPVYSLSLRWHRRWEAFSAGTNHYCLSLSVCVHRGI